MERLLRGAGIKLPKGFNISEEIKQAKQKEEQKAFEIAKIHVKLNFILRVLQKAYPIIYDTMIKEETEENNPIIEHSKKGEK